MEIKKTSNSVVLGTDKICVVYSLSFREKKESY